MKKSLLQSLRESITGETQDTSGFVNPDEFAGLETEGVPLPEEDDEPDEALSGIRADGTLNPNIPGVPELIPKDVTKDIQKHIRW